jgi:hypothetical protein
MSSTAIKLVGGLSSHDATAFAKDMHTEPEFLLSMRKSEGETQFACFVRNLTERPIPLSIPFGTMEGQPRLSVQALQALRAQNRNRFSVAAGDNSLPFPQEHEAQTDKSPLVPANGQATTTPRKRELL